MGANTSGESAPGYLLAADCGTTKPTDINTAAMATVDLILTVTGTY